MTSLSHRRAFAAWKYVAALGALLVAFFAMPALAEAQETMQLTPNYTPLRTAGAPTAGDGLGLHDHAGDITGVGYDDCIKDIIIDFSLNVSNINGSLDKIQVWAGTGSNDCTVDTNRNAPTNYCWPVSGAFPLNQTVHVLVHGRDLAQHVADVPPNLPTQYAAVAGPDACNAQAKAGVSNPPQITLYFFFMTGAQVAQGTTALQYKIDVDTFGPPAPTVDSNPNNAVTVGSTLLYVNWTPPAGASNITGFTVYCSPNPNISSDAAALPPIDAACVRTQSVPILLDPLDGATDDAADTGIPPSPDSGAADTGTSPDSSTTTTCTPPTGSGDGGHCSGGGPFTTGMLGSAISANFPQYVCGTTSGVTTTQLKMQNLTNNADYYFAVASQDKLNNIGPVVVVGCNYPGPISDFWNQYVEAGGQAGGGCSVVSGPGARKPDAPAGGGDSLDSVAFPAGTWLFGFVAIGAAGAVMRRRRRQ